MGNRNKELLAQKSRELLNDQLNTVDANNNKAGIFVSISSLFIPLAFSLFDKFNNSLIGVILFSIPIILNLIGLYFLIKSLLPKKLFHGINFNEFEKYINKSEDEIYLIEIGSNKDSFQDNKETLKKQNKNLKTGLTMIFIGAIALTLIFFIIFLINNCTCDG